MIERCVPDDSRRRALPSLRLVTMERARGEAGDGDEQR
jgi:hypothetical protein